MSDSEPRRGRSHNAQGAKEAILNAAEQVFAEHGFDGARIDAIAAAANYNKSLIFQYFGDKLGLYGAVVRRADEQTRDIQNEALSIILNEELDTPKIVALLRKYLEGYFDYLLENPRIMRIFMWEMAEGWQTYGKVLNEQDFKDVEIFSPALKRLQERGILRATANPLIQITIAIFSGAFYLGLIPIYEFMLPGEDFRSPEKLQQAREFIVEFVIKGLIVEPPAE